MKLSAIICEYNPLHNGHLSHINATKNITGCDGLVAVMSGNFVQRGEPAIFDKHIRAAAAVHAGADIVIELPTVAALSAADGFSLAAVRMLNSIKGVTHLSFGSESGSIADLDRLAQIMLHEPPKVSTLINRYLDSGDSFPLARAKAYKCALGDDYGDILSNPNNILGLEYIKALQITGSKIQPLTIKRAGADYHDSDYTAHLPSATAIRAALRQNRLSVLDSAVPAPSRPLYLQNFDHAEYLLADSRLYSLLQYRLFSLQSAEQLSNIADISEGLEYRIYAARHAADYQQFLEVVKTKRYTMARIKRILLNILLNITADDARLLRTAPPYYNILAVKKDKINTLLSLFDTNRITRRTDYDDISDTGTLRLIDQNITADDIYSVITARQTGRFFSGGILII